MFGTIAGVGTTADTSSTSGAWAAVCATVEAMPELDRSPGDWDRFADALFWTDRVHESIEARRRSYQGHRDGQDDVAAALAAWRLFYDHFLVGEDTVASGWRERCRRHVGIAGDARVEGWLTVADADVLMRSGDAAAAVECAARAAAAGTTHGDADLHAMALQVLGRAEIAVGRRTDGLSHLDEAMVSVINDELTPLYTGWVYCNVVSTCHGLADLRRAGEWSDAAMRWCATLREGLMYPGLCRVYAAELASLRGDLETAESFARRACEDLLAFDPRYSGEAHYLVADLCRIAGRTAEAEALFIRAHELGRDPQPGLARLRASQGDVDEALAALQSALRPGPAAPLPRVDLLSAVVEVGGMAGATEAIRAAAGEIVSLGRDGDSTVLVAHAAAAAGTLHALDGETEHAIGRYRAAVDAFAELGCAPDEARQRLALGQACAAVGDAETGRLEISAAEELFRRVSATADAERAAASLRALAAPTDQAPSVSPLTAREIEVLSLVAEGMTDTEVADALVVSHHTVARHVGNIRTKLGVSSRAAATSRAFELGLLGDRAD